MRLRKHYTPLLAVPFVMFSILMGTSHAHAQDEQSEPQEIKEEFEAKGGLFASIQGGITLPSDGSFNGIQTPAAASPGAAGAPANINVGYDNAATFTSAIGYRIPKRVFGLFQPSVELEYSYAKPNISSGSFNGGNQSFSGDVSINSFTLNYQSDLRWSNDQKVIPFIGGGIGIADVDSNITYSGSDTATSPSFAVRGSDIGFSTKNNIGVRLVLNDNLDLQTRLRYQRISGLDFDRRFIANGNDALNANVNGRYETVTLLTGLRYNF